MWQTGMFRKVLAFFVPVIQPNLLEVLSLPQESFSATTYSLPRLHWRLQLSFLVPVLHDLCLQYPSLAKLFTFCLLFFHSMSTCFIFIFITVLNSVSFMNQKGFCLINSDLWGGGRSCPSFHQSCLSLYVDLQYLKWLALLSLPAQGSAIISNVANSKCFLPSGVCVFSYPVVFFKIPWTLYIQEFCFLSPFLSPGLFYKSLGFLILFYITHSKAKLLS